MEGERTGRRRKQEQNEGKRKGLVKLLVQKKIIAAGALSLECLSTCQSESSCQKTALRETQLPKHF